MQTTESNEQFKWILKRVDIHILWFLNPAPFFNRHTSKHEKNQKNVVQDMYW